MTKISLNKEHQRMLQKWLLSGLATGVGVGSGVSMVNWLKSVQQDASEARKEEDDTIYVNVNRPTKAANFLEGAWAPGLIATGGLTAAAGGYALVRNLAQALKRKQLQERIDKAQQIYVDGVLGPPNTGDKEANSEGRGPGAGETLGAIMSAIPYLIAATSGGLAYKALDKYFPKLKPTENRELRPKRVVVRYRKQNEEQEPEVDKEASFEVSDTEEQLSRAFMIRCACEMEKQAGVESDLLDLVSAVTQGRFEEMQDHIKSRDLDTCSVLDLIKGASYEPANELQEAIAFDLLSKSASLSPVAEILAVSAIIDHIPRLVLNASEYGQAPHLAFQKIAAVIEIAERQDFNELINDASKSAAEIKEIPAVSDNDLLKVLSALHDTQEGKLVT